MLRLVSLRIVSKTQWGPTAAAATVLAGTLAASAACVASEGLLDRLDCHEEVKGSQAAETLHRFIRSAVSPSVVACEAATSSASSPFVYPELTRGIATR
jgi:hypothetical protein